MKAFSILKLALGAGSVLLSLLCFLYFFAAYWSVSETQKWPQVSATIKETTVNRANASKGVTYCPKSMVSFQLNGATHTSELQTSDLVCSRSEVSAQQAAGAWPIGKEILIHANPAKLTQVRLVGYALNVADYLVLFVGCLCLLLLLPLRKLKAKSAAAQP